MKLLLSQKNELFNLIRQSDLLSPNDFKFSDNGIMGGGGVMTEIIHSSNRYYFRIFDESIACSPGYETLTYTTMHRRSWDTILTYYKRWLAYLLREISVEDEWTKMAQDSKFFEIDDDNIMMFSIDEQKFIVDKIEKLKENIRSIENIDSLQFEKINKKLDHLEEMVSELNNIDWKNLFIGTILSMMARITIPSDAHQHLWNLFKSFFSGIILLK